MALSQDEASYLMSPFWPDMAASYTSFVARWKPLFSTGLIACQKKAKITIVLYLSHLGVILNLHIGPYCIVWIVF